MMGHIPFSIHPTYSGIVTAGKGSLVVAQVINLRIWHDHAVWWDILPAQSVAIVSGALTSALSCSQRVVGLPILSPYFSLIEWE
jgi:hypothetical protein